MTSGASQIAAEPVSGKGWPSIGAEISRREPRKLAAFVLAAIFGLVLLDIALLGLEIATGWDDRPFHLLSITSHVVILGGLSIGFMLLRHNLSVLARGPMMLEELRRSKEALETASLAKNRYLANVSHEIRSPLNAIYGYAQLIEQEADVRPKDAARVIRRCAEHMTSIVESLLDISRVENGLLRVRSEIVRLPEFIEQIVLMMRPAAQAKGIEFIHEVRGNLPEFVRTDQSRFRQALINLLTNAIKFTEQGSVTFRVTYRGQVATFEIIDTGRGIADADQLRVFDPYERVSQDSQSGEQGVGLGLPITKAIVEILGGKLELESTAGEGATFRVVMMLSEVSHMHAPEIVQRRISGYEGPQRSVLLVDDDPDQRSFLEKFLQSCGFEVVAVPNGETAVSLCGLRPFDLAILDISMPGISGWETAVRIRECADYDLAVIMASANAPEFHRPEHSKPVHDHFLVKPYALDEMARVIGGLLNLSWKWEAAGTPDLSSQSESESGFPAEAWPHVKRLKELIRIGHVRGIEAEIGVLASRAPGSGRLVTALYAALDEFDLSGMTRLLEGK
jgi:signal transduction histidine kinase/DNA-binding NarL/FixJ family response regulator